MSKNSQTNNSTDKEIQTRLGPLGNLNQVVKGLAKTIRAMANGTIDSQLGGLGIVCACLETAVVTEVVVNGAVRAPMTPRRIVPLIIQRKNNGRGHRRWRTMLK